MDTRRQRRRFQRIAIQRESTCRARSCNGEPSTALFDGQRESPHDFRDTASLHGLSVHEQQQSRAVGGDLERIGRDMEISVRIEIREPRRPVIQFRLETKIIEPPQGVPVQPRRAISRQQSADAAAWIRTAEVPFGYRERLAGLPREFRDAQRNAADRTVRPRPRDIRKCP